MSAYYNENDPKAAAWLRELMKAGLIMDGEVDERDIQDVLPTDLAGFDRCHFFAGIGGWDYALQLAGWPEDRPVWTGSCPCQPFSQAGQGKGFDDERHLWPAWQWLIEQCRPPVVFGEQVASKAGREWFRAVQTDLQGMGYDAAAADICAAGIGAPHWRQRLWFVGVADAECRPTEPDGYEVERTPRSLQGETREQRFRAELGDGSNAGQLAHTERHRQHGRGDIGPRWRAQSANECSPVGLADTPSGDTGAEREQRSGEHGLQPQDRGAGWMANAEIGSFGPHDRQSGESAQPQEQNRGCGVSGRLANSHDTGPQGRRILPERAAEQPVGPGGMAGGESRTSPLNGFWRDADWLCCTDGRWRPAQPGTFPLAHGISGRVGLLRGYGNAIVPQVAAEFVGAVMELSL